MHAVDFLLLNWQYYCSFFHFGTNCLTDFQILNDWGGGGGGGGLSERKKEYELKE